MEHDDGHPKTLGESQPSWVEWIEMEHDDGHPKTLGESQPSWVEWIEINFYAHGTIAAIVSTLLG